MQISDLISNLPTGIFTFYEKTKARTSYTERSSLYLNYIFSSKSKIRIFLQICLEMKYDLSIQSLLAAKNGIKEKVSFKNLKNPVGIPSL